MSDRYRFEVLPPSSGDPYEPNNTIDTATAWEDVTPSQVTLHKGMMTTSHLLTGNKLYALELVYQGEQCGV